MTSTTADRHRPFSLDPAQWPRQWRAAAMLALDGPLLRSLRPASRVALRHADGQTRVWRLVRGQAHAVPGAPGGAELPALQLPAERVLERRLLLPPLAPDDLAQAVQLDVAASSPFGAAQTVHGWSVRRAADQLVQVDVALDCEAPQPEAVVVRDKRLRQLESQILRQHTKGASLHFGAEAAEPRVRRGPTVTRSERGLLC